MQGENNRLYCSENNRHIVFYCCPQRGIWIHVGIFLLLVYISYFYVKINYRFNLVAPVASYSYCCYHMFLSLLHSFVDEISFIF